MRGAMIMELRATLPCPSQVVQTARQCPLYDYFLWLPQSRGWRMIEPDCSALPQVQNLPGVRYKGGQPCSFTRRQSLEQAMRMAATLAPDPKRDTILALAP